MRITEISQEDIAQYWSNIPDGDLETTQHRIGNALVTQTCSEIVIDLGSTTGIFIDLIN